MLTTTASKANFFSFFKDNGVNDTTPTGDVIALKTAARSAAMGFIYRFPVEVLDSLEQVNELVRSVLNNREELDMPLLVSCDSFYLYVHLSGKHSEDLFKIGHRSIMGQPCFVKCHHGQHGYQSHDSHYGHHRNTTSDIH